MMASAVPDFSVDHVCIAVRDAARACRLFIDVMGGTFVGGGDNPRLGVRAVQIKLGAVKVELLEPLDPDGYLAAYIDRHGEGFHHLTLYTDDVVAADATVTAAGFETVDLDTDHPSWLETFTRPSSTFGALIQLSTPRDPWPDAMPGVTLSDVLEGAVHVLDNVVTWKKDGSPIWPV